MKQHIITLSLLLSGSLYSAAPAVYQEAAYIKAAAAEHHAPVPNNDSVELLRKWVVAAKAPMIDPANKQVCEILDTWAKCLSKSILYEGTGSHVARKKAKEYCVKKHSYYLTGAGKEAFFQSLISSILRLSPQIKDLIGAEGGWRAQYILEDILSLNNMNPKAFYILMPGFTPGVNSLSKYNDSLISHPTP